MDVKDLIKLQFVSQMSQNPGGGDQSSMQALLFRVLQMGLISIVDDVIKAVPRAFEATKRLCASYFATQVISKVRIDAPTLAESSVQLHTRHSENEYAMMRKYDASTCGPATSDVMVDAVLAQVSKLTNVPAFQLLSNGQAMITYREKPIQMTRDIYCRLGSVDTDAKGAISKVSLKLISNTLAATELAAYVSDLHQAHVKELNNSLGGRTYYFDQKSKDGDTSAASSGSATPDMLHNQKRMMINAAPKHLSFTMAPFYSNKRLSNIFGEEARLVEKRMRFFIENREWYDAKGIPYQIGLLLSGVPGSGKTSILKALANYTRRHLVNVNFANITTASQLKNLFYSPNLQAYTDSSLISTQSYYIPIDQRIYVLEEIDAIGDVVKQRGCSDDANKPRPPIHDELTLAEILTVLDGTMEIPGRIVVMTSNHPEVLDAALIRPGRIDVHVNFGYAKRELIAEMVASYLDMPDGFPLTRIAEIPHEVLTPAEVGQVIFAHFDTPQSELVDVLIAAFAHAALTARKPKDHAKERKTLNQVQEKNEKEKDDDENEDEDEDEDEDEKENLEEDEHKFASEHVDQPPTTNSDVALDQKECLSHVIGAKNNISSIPHEQETDTEIVHMPPTPPSCLPPVMFAAANEYLNDSSSPGSVADSSTDSNDNDVSASPMFACWPPQPPLDSWHGASVIVGSSGRNA